MRGNLNTLGNRNTPGGWITGQRLGVTCSTALARNRAERRESSGGSTPEGGGLQFKDGKAAYSALSTSVLARTYLVLQMCRVRLLVDNAEGLLSISRRVLGDGFVSAMVRPTFFGHFCAGEDETSITPTVQFLRQSGVGAILDYAAEADVDDAPADASDNSDANRGGAGRAAVTTDHEGVESARTYAYTTEKECEANVKIFETAIRAVHNVSPEGFAAVKITALGNPALLERWSSSLIEIRRLFRTFDSDGSGMVSREEFEGSWTKHFVDTPESLELMNSLFKRFDKSGNGNIDVVEWTTGLDVQDTSWLAEQCIKQGPFAQAALDQDEVTLVSHTMRRLHHLAELAESLDVRLMFDAEHTYFQPAIHNMVLNLQRKHNVEKPRIFNTFQCYLTRAPQEIQEHIERSEREQWHFACKLVRGAYMVLERARADELGYKSPIHDTIQDTHDCYNTAVETVLCRSAVKEGRSRANMLIASHNTDSVALTVDLLEREGLDRRNCGVYFGQLLGMADHISFLLGKEGFKAYKYVPYGKFLPPSPKTLLPYSPRCCFFCFRHALPHVGLWPASKTSPSHLPAACHFLL